MEARLDVADKMTGSWEGGVGGGRLARRDGRGGSREAGEKS